MQIRKTLNSIAGKEYGITSKLEVLYAIIGHKIKLDALMLIPDILVIF